MLILEHDNNFKRYNGKESDFQISAMKLLSHYTDKAFHVKNEGIKSCGGGQWHYGKKKKAEGVKEGVSDIICLKRCNGYNGLAIELKSKYNTLSDSQIKFLCDAYDEGWFACAVWSLDKFEQILKQYFKK